MVSDYQCVTSDRVAPSRKMGKRLQLYVLTRYQYLFTLFSGRITPGGVGRLQILEALIIIELYQCYPPTPIWQDAYEKASQVDFVDTQATLAGLYLRGDAYPSPIRTQSEPLDCPKSPRETEIPRTPMQGQKWILDSH